MKVEKFNLQLFSEGSEGASASAEGFDGNESGAAKVALSEQVATAQSDGNTADPLEDDDKAFDALIKKGGKYAKQFQERNQAIINKRFAQTKEMEAKLNSQNSIMELLSQKYGVDGANTDDLLKAIEEDDSLYEKAAFEKGIDVKTYKEMAKLERENAKFKAEADERMRQQKADSIYKGWEEQGEALKSKYGINDFSLQVEAQNPDFINLLSNGVDLETAYKVMHFDDMLGGGMAATAENVVKNLAQSISSRSTRPSENGISSSANGGFTTDVNSMSDQQILELVNRSLRGERISF